MGGREEIRDRQGEDQAETEVIWLQTTHAEAAFRSRKRRVKQWPLGASGNKHSFQSLSLQISDPQNCRRIGPRGSNLLHSNRKWRRCIFIFVGGFPPLLSIFVRGQAGLSVGHKEATWLCLCSLRELKSRCAVINLKDHERVMWLATEHACVI
jgi:hypothetical protein